MVKYLSGMVRVALVLCVPHRLWRHEGKTDPIHLSLWRLAPAMRPVSVLCH